MVGVAGEHDPARERDPLAGQAVRVAAPVPALVLVADRLRHLLHPGDLAQDLLADHRVVAHHPRLLGGQRSARAEDLGRHAELADVVEGGDPGDHLDLARGQAEPRADLAHQVRGRGRVRAGVVVADVEGRGQGEDRGLVAGRELGLVVDVVEPEGDDRGVRLDHLDLLGLGPQRLARIGGEGAEDGSVGKLQRHREARPQPGVAGHLAEALPTRVDLDVLADAGLAGERRRPAAAGLGTDLEAVDRDQVLARQPGGRGVVEAIALEEQDRAELGIDQATELVDRLGEEALRGARAARGPGSLLQRRQPPSGCHRGHDIPRGSNRRKTGRA